MLREHQNHKKAEPNMNQALTYATCSLSLARSRTQIEYLSSVRPIYWEHVSVCYLLVDAVFCCCSYLHIVIVVYAIRVFANTIYTLIYIMYAIQFHRCLCDATPKAHIHVILRSLILPFFLSLSRTLTKKRIKQSKRERKTTMEDCNKT